MGEISHKKQPMVRYFFTKKGCRKIGPDNVTILFIETDNLLIKILQLSSLGFLKKKKFRITLESKFREGMFLQAIDRRKC